MAKLRLSDIAKAAGVSTASVSNALNHKSGINREKAEQIRQLAVQMGYLPVGEDEKSGIRLVIYKKHGKVVMDTAFFAQLIEGVQDECQKLGCDLLINHARSGDDISHLTDMPILLLATEMNSDDLRPWKNVEHPVLLLDSDFRYEPFSSVSIDNREAGYLAAQCLIRNGHTRIGFLDSSLPFNNMEDRFRGFEDALTEEGLTTFARVKLEPTVEGACRDMEYWLSTSPQLPTAFFAGNDIMAVGAMWALKQAGYKLSRDLSIVGMDDMPMSMVVEPPLTTIRVDKHKLGSIAVNRLYSMMKGDVQVSQRVRMSVSLVERESVRAL